MVKTKVCPMCRKEFAGKSALRQHMQTKHQAQKPVVVQAAPAKKKNRGRGRNPRAGFDRVESGVDILHTTTIPASALVGAMIFSLTLAVEDLVGTRFASVASLWSRWRPRSLRLEVIPSAGATVSGNYIVGWVGDPDYTLGNGDAAIRTVAAMQPSQQRHISKPMTFVIPAAALQKWYLTFGTVDGETSHGKLFGVLSSAIGNLTSDSSISFSLRLHWSVEFSSPRLPEVAESETIYAEDDYTPYFTDSSSDWADGKYLSLKERAGGNLVPFPGAKPGVVYKIDSKAVLQYKIGNGKVGNISYGVRIPNYYSSAMAVFDSLQNAIAFSTSGNSAYCLPYYAAGDYVKPNNPAWTMVRSTVSKTARTQVKTLEMSSDYMQSKVHDLELKLDKLMTLMQDTLKPSTSQPQAQPPPASRPKREAFPSAPPEPVAAPGSVYPSLQEFFRDPGQGSRYS